MHGPACTFWASLRPLSHARQIASEDSLADCFLSVEELAAVRSTGGAFTAPLQRLYSAFTAAPLQRRLYSGAFTPLRRLYSAFTPRSLHAAC
jgi:hypothetical protein